MYPILTLSLVGLTLILERLWTFWRFFRAPTPEAALAGRTPAQRFDTLQVGLGLISTIITAEPMLGILGTVTGIIKTFDAFRLADSASSPLVATAGIGEALITTAAGLIAALLLLFPYNLLTALLNRAAARLDSFSEGK